MLEIDPDIHFAVGTAQGRASISENGIGDNRPKSA